jgi:hypothetical protein
MSERRCSCSRLDMHLSCAPPAPPPDVEAQAREWLVWNTQEGCWWRADECGYTRDIFQAGRYTRADAERCCVKRSQIPGQPPTEVAVLAPEAVAAALERARGEARAKAFEEAANFVAQPSGHYQIGITKQPYWDGATLAVELANRAARARAPQGPEKPAE